MPYFAYIFRTSRGSALLPRQNRSAAGHGDAQAQGDANQEQMFSFRTKPAMAPA
jgi:hypothetical protein